MTLPHSCSEDFRSFASERPARFGRTGPAPAHEDERLVVRAVERAKEGDTSALHYIYARYADDVYAYVKSIVMDPHDAEDVAQSVFAKLITAINKYERRSSPFPAWLMRVARNAALDHLRARRVLPCGDIHASEERDEEPAHERGLALKQALELLPAEQREVLVLRHIAGLTPAQIADLLGKSEGSIHGLHHRGRRALRSTLRDLEAAPLVRSA
jgi:RNA polymerase sigma-70 factor, ECF subfamily